MKNVISIKQSLLMTAFWVSLALFFNLFIYWFRGWEDALNFLTGYLIEYSLSIDNLFVFLWIFSAFKVPNHLRYHVLFWGILGAIAMRMVFIIGGITLLKKFSWMFYIFGAFLIYTGIQLALPKKKEMPSENKFIQWFKKHFSVTKEFHDQHFFIRIDQRLFATPLFLVLLAIETTDLIFALDSIPAILGITTDLLIVYTSNIFAILGLRSLYFALSGMLNLFQYLHYGLAIILIFIGGKMLLSSVIHVPILITLGVICLTLAASIVLSIYTHKSSQ